MRQSYLCEHTLVLYHNCNHHTVPTSQSEVTVVQSDDNHPRQDDESDQVTNTEGLYMCGHCVWCDTLVHLVMIICNLLVCVYYHTTLYGRLI